MHRKGCDKNEPGQTYEVRPQGFPHRTQSCLGAHSEAARKSRVRSYTKVKWYVVWVLLQNNIGKVNRGGGEGRGAIRPSARRWGS